MNIINDIISNKSLKPKQKTELLSEHLLNRDISATQVVEFAEKAKDPAKATCIEALEFATKVNAQIVDEHTFDYVVKSLNAKAPRIKWESAKVITNTAHLYINNLDAAIQNLLQNTNHSGTVVRWSAALALSNILQLKTEQSKALLPTIKSICECEEKNSIKKIYLTAIKKSS